ncbi:hypothetical protein LX15_002919 [Streptoalloteichus tenebrarius]|uniref:Uncharacterized protein n=1 Tax=Streptoalloteichus tenebrarius (strain ATCC 17920 / DSM 40477 / JCM 4838 / CBS 697.72 / NBRC 16177 / NCIMB 11028 / NRRL B-12390 / A12253. 1 / ISP 5477) TaxID=1933 RepID=A0ABT1HUL3_STRSD|nr:hypothetical protein [Streptoalloteichus tenebrarius]
MAMAMAMARSGPTRAWPRHLLGRVTASERFLGYGALPIGAVLAGALATGLRTAAWVICVAQALCVLALVLSSIH